MLLPPDEEELRMRVENLLWRCDIVSDAVLRIGACELHSSSLQLVTPDETIDLRRMEFLLLQKLLSYPGRIFTRPQLMDELWGYDSESEPRTVDTHIKLLRRKLKNVEDIRIQTVRGLGYRFVRWSTGETTETINITVDGVTGTMTWDDTGAVSKTPNAVVIENGEYVSFSK